MAEQWDALEREFAETGVCVVRGVLSGDQVHAMREALAADREEHASEWNIFGRSRDGGPIGESGRWQSNNIMLHSEAYDAVVAHPAVLPLVRRLMGDPVLTGTGACVRDPVHEPAPAFGDVWPVGTDAVAPWPRTRSSAAGSPTSRTMEPNRIHWQMWVSVQQLTPQRLFAKESLIEAAAVTAPRAGRAAPALAPPLHPVDAGALPAGQLRQHDPHSEHCAGECRGQAGPAMRAPRGGALLPGHRPVHRRQLAVSRHDVAGIWVAFFSRHQRYRC